MFCVIHQCMTRGLMTNFGRKIKTNCVRLDNDGGIFETLDSISCYLLYLFINVIQHLLQDYIGIKIDIWISICCLIADIRPSHPSPLPLQGTFEVTCGGERGRRNVVRYCGWFNDQAIAPCFARSSSGVVMRCGGWFSCDSTYVNNNGEADKWLRIGEGRRRNFHKETYRKYIY